MAGFGIVTSLSADHPVGFIFSLRYGIGECAPSLQLMKLAGGCALRIPNKFHVMHKACHMPVPFAAAAQTLGCFPCCLLACV